MLGQVGIRWQPVYRCRFKLSIDSLFRRRFPLYRSARRWRNRIFDFLSVESDVAGAPRAGQYLQTHSGAGNLFEGNLSSVRHAVDLADMTRAFWISGERNAFG